MKNYRILAFVPARGGSRSIKLKNIKPFCGKPLIYWVLNALSKVEDFEIKIVVATDCKETEEIVNNFYFNKVEVFRRSKENAMDKSSTESVMLEYLRRFQHSVDSNDFFVLAQATSPFISPVDIAVAMTKIINDHYDSLLSCTRIKRFLWTEEGKPLNYDFLKRPFRQDFKGILMENGAFYINKVNNIIKYGNRLSGRIGIHEMPEYSSVELDHPDDWVVAEWLMNKYVLKKENIFRH